MIIISDPDVLAQMPVGYLIRLSNECGIYAVRRERGWWSIGYGYHEPELPVEAIGLPQDAHAGRTAAVLAA